MSLEIPVSLSECFLWAEIEQSQCCTTPRSGNSNTGARVMAPASPRARKRSAREEINDNGTSTASSRARAGVLMTNKPRFFFASCTAESCVCVFTRGIRLDSSLPKWRAFVHSTVNPTRVTACSQLPTFVADKMFSLSSVKPS